MYPIGIQNFESIREGGYVYVDKTHLIHQLATTGKYYFLSRPRRFGKSLLVSKYYFLSRPRRFGKSLLVSTMEAYFQGKKALFKGLAIEKLEKDWTAYPVLHLDLSGKTYNKAEDLEMLLDMHLCRWEKAFDMQTRYSEPDIRFQTLIDTAYEKTGKPVVILIDEYDKPLLDSAGNEELREAYRSRLQGFYSVMKTRDGKIRFGFLTGITKLGKLSVFSGLNNLNDISMDWEFSGICGISEKELHTCFDQEVSAMAQANRLTDIYNPFSLLSALRKKRFSDYWYETGTPTFVVKALRSGKFNLEDLTLEGVPASALGGVNADDSDPVPVLYQSGYLTIKSYDERWESYTLKYPNKEVECGFMEGLAKQNKRK